MKTKRLLPLGLALVLLLSACGKKGAEATPTPTPDPTPTVAATPTSPPTPRPEPEPTGPANPLTGLAMEDEADTLKRPVAIMLNNLKEAMPQQGQSQADIIYECLEEGGITRMMGVYQSVKDVGTVGSIRSARSYFLELALGHDAIFIHAGGSDEPKYEDAYGKIKAWGVTSLDGVRGPYMSNNVKGGLMWRDPDRRLTMSREHTVVTSGEMMEQVIWGLSIRQEHEENWNYQMPFAADGTPTEGTAAATIRVPFSNYKTGVFTYDEERSLYLIEEYGKPYIDGNTGEQVGVTNVVVVKTRHTNTGDSYGHITVDLGSGGTGYFACGGKLIDIRWTKERPSGQFQYTDLQGNSIVFGQGKTYVNVIPDDKVVEIT